MDRTVDLSSGQLNPGAPTHNFDEQPLNILTLPPEIRQRIFSFVPPQLSGPMQETCRQVNQDMLEHPVKRAHVKSLWSTATGIEDPLVCTAALKQQHNIWRNMHAGRCERKYYFIPDQPVVQLAFAAQPEMQGVYFLFMATCRDLQVARISPQFVGELTYIRPLSDEEDRDDEVMDMAVSADYQYVALAIGEMGAVLVKPDAPPPPPENLLEGLIRFANAGRFRHVSTISATSNFAHIVTGSRNYPEVCVWARDDLKKPLHVLDGLSHTYGVRFSPGGQSIVAWQNQDDASTATSALIWPDWKGSPNSRQEVEDPRYVQTGEIAHYKTVTDVNFSPDGQFIVTASEDHTANVYDRWNKTKLIKKIDTLTNARPRNLHDEDYDNSGIHAAKFDPNSRFLATASSSIDARRAPLHLWKPTECPLKRRTLYAHNETNPLLESYTCSLLAFSSNNQYLAVSTEEEGVHIFTFDR